MSGIYISGAVIEAGNNWYLSEENEKKSLKIVFDSVSHLYGKETPNTPIKSGTRFVIESVDEGAASCISGLSDSPSVAVVSQLKKNGKFDPQAPKYTVDIAQDWTDNNLSGRKAKVVGQMQRVYV